MSDSDRQEMIDQFCEVTGTSVDQARHFLEAENWTLQLALSSFYETDSGNLPSNAIDHIDDDEGAAALPSSFSHVSIPPKGAKKEKKPKTQSTGGARIMTLNNMDSSSDDDEEQSGQAFYAGGSDRSGQQVLGPPRKNDYVAEVFRTAKESGAEVIENADEPAGSSSRSFFSGSGYRLGQTNDDHVLLPDGGHSDRSEQNIDPVILRLWRQGFTINDGELRLYDERKNKEFLDYVTKGQLPPELRQQGDNMVQVNLEDHRHEDYKLAVPKVKPFSGKGHTLGSPLPDLSDSTTSSVSVLPSSTSYGSNEDNEKLANEHLNVDSTAPVTTIQIRLADGSRLSGRFNHTHTIEDIRRFIATARPQYATQSFALLTTFPSKELTNASDTVEAAKLLNSAIMQRLK